MGLPQGDKMVKTERRLTKSGYVTGLQCDKLFWIYQNRRDSLPEPDESTQAIFDQGHLVGDLAKTLFPNGTEINWSAADDGGIAQTRAALCDRKPIFEAVIRHGSLYARPDILKPAPGGLWDLIEVKSSSKVKDDHIPDVAFQKHVYESSGVRIRRCFVMHVDRSYVRKGLLDCAKLFYCEDVTGDVEEILGTVPSEARRLLSVMSKSRCPEVEVGGQCKECDLYDDCWAFLPKRNVFSLVRGGKKCFELKDRGILKIRDIPGDFSLTHAQSIQVACEKTRKAYIEPGAIRTFIGQLEYPLHFLDFETFGIAVPPYELSRPNDHIPFQYSLHIVEAPGKKARHHSFLSDGVGDPRPELTSTLKAQIGRKGSIVAFHASFENAVLTSCAEYFPEFCDWVNSIRTRIVDLEAPFRGFQYYHPGQMGSTSLKVVLPALTKRSYKGLAIADGNAASLRFRDLAFGNLDERAKKKIRQDLEKYCHQDTEGMIDILKVLEHT
jgi:hypothetical protein